MVMITLSNIVCFFRHCYLCVNFILIDNRILENNATLQSHCIKLEEDVHHLRLNNAGLEKASEAR